MQHYGIIGYPLGHSFSQRYFTEKFAREGIAARYDTFPLREIGDFPKLLLDHPDLRGLNVTIPHKVSVMRYLDSLDETARAVGAVNVIRIHEGRLTGFNTDTIGFRRSLASWLTATGNMPKYAEPIPEYAFAFPLDGPPWEFPREVHALILGTGGASKAVAHALEILGLTFQYVSRRPTHTSHISYKQMRALSGNDFTLIVNTTPLGTYPDVDTCPNIPFSLLDHRHLVYDLVYNPAETLLLRRAVAQGAAIKNGLEMLHIQAEAAWEIWQTHPGLQIHSP